MAFKNSVKKSQQKKMTKIRNTPWCLADDAKFRCSVEELHSFVWY